MTAASGGRLAGKVALVAGAGTSAPGWSIGKARRHDGARAGGFPGADTILKQLAERAPRREPSLLRLGLISVGTLLWAWWAVTALEIWPELPKSGANKILRREVKERVLASKPSPQS